MVITWLNRAGITFLYIWGSTINKRVSTKLNPWDWAPSNCPFGMEFKPPRNISAMTAEVKREIANTDTPTLFPFTVK